MRPSTFVQDSEIMSTVCLIEAQVAVIPSFDDHDPAVDIRLNCVSVTTELAPSRVQSSLYICKSKRRPYIGLHKDGLHYNKDTVSSAC